MKEVVEQEQKIYGKVCTEKSCACCKEIKPISKFFIRIRYEKNSTLNGRRYHSSYCRKCHNIKANDRNRRKGRLTYKYRKEKLKRYEAKYPEKIQARKAVKTAIKNGILKRLPCFCGETKVEAHHHKGYEKENQLNVVWLCHKHHTETYINL